MPTIGADGFVPTIDIGKAVPPIAGEQLGQLQTKQYETLSSSDIDTLTIGTGASPSLTIQRVVGGSTVGSWQWTMDASNNLVLDRVTGTGIYVWNEVGASVDFRMEGDTDTEVFFLDGSENRVGFSTTTPATLVDIQGALTVNGILSQDDVTDTTSTTTGSIHTDGGIGIAKALWVGTTSRLVGNATFDAGILAAGNDQGAIGASGTAFSDLFLASGAVINFAAGDVTITHATDKLTLGGTTVEFDFANHEMTNVDINSGAIDGTTIGAASAAAGTFLAVVATTITGVGTLSLDGDLAFVGPQAITTSTGDLTLNPAGDIACGSNDVTGIGTLTATTLAGTLSTATQNTVTTMTGLVTTGALNSGTITSGFGNIDNGSSTLGTGIITTVGDLSLDGDLDFVGPQAITTSTGDLTLNPAGDVVISDNLTVSGTGPHAIGGATATNVRLRLFGSFTPASSVGNIRGILVDGALTGAAGDTGFLTGTDFENNIVTQTATENIAVISQVRIVEPAITDNLTGDITVATTVHIVSAPTEGEVNYALLVDAGLSRFDDSIFINETLNANMTIGLTINQGAADNQILALKSSDVATGLTTIVANTVETDDFGVFYKALGAEGGLHIQSLAENAVVANVMEIESYGGTAVTGKTTSTGSLIQIFAAEHNGSNALRNITTDGNVFAIRAYVGGTSVNRFLVDAEGDIHSVTVVDVTGTGNALAASAFDDYDDALLVRALDVARTPAALIRSEWDKHVRYNEQSLIDADILGAPVAEGGMTNITQLQRLHNGAIWQAYVERQEMKLEMEILVQRLESTEKKLALLAA